MNSTKPSKVNTLITLEFVNLPAQWTWKNNIIPYKRNGSNKHGSYHRMVTEQMVWPLPGSCFKKDTILPVMGIPITKVKWSLDCLVFIMGIPTSETERSSTGLTWHPWPHWKLSHRQPSVSSVTIAKSPWWLFKSVARCPMLTKDAALNWLRPSDAYIHQ